MTQNVKKSQKKNKLILMNIVCNQDNQFFICVLVMKMLIPQMTLIETKVNPGVTLTVVWDNNLPHNNYPCLFY